MKFTRIDQNSNAKSGFSLLEITIIIGILGIIAGGAMLTLQSSKNHMDLDNAQANVLYAIEQARNRSATGVGNTAHGVRIEKSRIVVFDGNEYEEGMGSEIIFPALISSNQSDANIIFNRINAAPNTSMTIMLNHADGATKSITVTQEGVITAD